MSKKSVCLAVVLGLVVGLGAASLVGCKKKPNTQGVTAATAKEDVILDNTLVERIPEKSFAFYRFDGKSPAYARLMASPWGQKGVPFLPKKSDERVEKIYRVLSAFGLDPDNRDAWQKFFSEAVVFAVHPSAENNETAYGVIFRPDGVNLAEKIKSGKEALLRLGNAVEDLSIGDAAGLSFTTKEGEGDPRQYYLAAQGDTGVFCSSRVVLEDVLAKKGCAVPGFIHDEAFHRAVVGIPTAPTRFSLGVLDLHRALGTDNADPSSEKNAFQTLVVTFAMDDAPKTVAHLGYDQAALKADSVLSVLHQSPAQELLAYAPERPLLFLSIDGPTLKRIRDAAVKLQPADAAPTTAAKMAFIDAIDRLALVAAVAPLGQTMLPVPNLAVIIETKDSATAMAGIQNAISGSLGENRATSGMSWTEKDIDGTNKMKAIISPFQLGAFLAAKDNLVFLTSTEAQVRDAFSGKSKDGFSKSLGASEANTILGDTPSIANLYLDFQELAKLLDNMKGMLTMFAPQTQNAASFLDQESLQAMAKQGQMLGWLNAQPGMLELRYSYQPPREQK